MIKVVCPHCAAESSWKDERWGTNIRCPSCRKIITAVPPDIYSALEEERERARKAERKVIPVSLVLENVRSAYNVGSILRTADGCGISRVYLCGITPSGDNPRVIKTSLGAEQSVQWETADSAAAAATRLREEGVAVYALENSEGAADLTRFDIRFPAAFLLGNEVGGLSPDALSGAEAVLALPMLGMKSSLNVASAAAVCGYVALMRYREKLSCDT